MNYQNGNGTAQADQDVMAQMNEVRELAKRMTATVYREHQRRVAVENKVVALEEWKAHKEQDRAGVARLSWRLSSRGAGRVRPAQLAIIKQMIGQVSRGSAGDYQADDRASVTRLRWRLSIR